MINIIRWSLALLGCCALVFNASSTTAAGFPENPVRLVVGFAPGGATDLFARLIGDKLSQKWGQRVLIDNRPGANCAIAYRLVAAAVPNGYTLAMAAATLTVTPSIQKLDYDPVNGFAPVSRLASQPALLLVKASSSVNSVT